MLKPTIASEWIRIVEYPDHHLNDFCLFQDYSGIWHCMGIMGTGTWESEQSLFHCSSEHLLASYKHRLPILTERPSSSGDPQVNMNPQKHAPFVVLDREKYHMFYRRPPGTILCVRSINPYKWRGLGELVFEKNDARDLCILKIGDTFYMYYCQFEEADGIDRSCIMMRSSRDLEVWGEPSMVYVDTMKSARHSYLESPYVVKRPEGFYLFIRHRLLDEDCATVVLYSDRPDRFPSGERRWICAIHGIHAPEIVMHGGRHFIARVSGPPHGNRDAPPTGGWIEIAQLDFV